MQQLNIFAWKLQQWLMMKTTTSAKTTFFLKPKQPPASTAFEFCTRTIWRRGNFSTPEFKMKKWSNFDTDGLFSSLSWFRNFFSTWRSPWRCSAPRWSWPSTFRHSTAAAAACSSILWLVCSLFPLWFLIFLFTEEMANLNS